MMAKHYHLILKTTTIMAVDGHFALQNVLWDSPVGPSPVPSTPLLFKASA